MTTQTAALNPKFTEIRCAAAPLPGGHYAQAILHGGSLYVSGQLGVAPGVSDTAASDVAKQVAFALGNIERLARVVGAGRDDVVRCTVFVANVEHWDAVNQAYAAFFDRHRPARSVVPCPALHYGAKVEIEAVVAVGR